MAEVHQHPDGLVYVRTSGMTYEGTTAEFEQDFGIHLPLLPDGAVERIYTQGKRHAVMGSGNLIEGGQMPWPLGDQLIAEVAQAVTAQHNRRNPPLTLDQAKERKGWEIESEYGRRASEPITFNGHQWHADAAAVQNIMGVVLMIQAGAQAPDPRPWTPKDRPFEPVQLSHANLVALGAAIMQRRDALFNAKKQKQQEVLALNSIAEINNYSLTADWPT